MNSTPQLDLHPDAESLNAFAEQAVSVPEREKILAHLALCSRCRQVIFLAQQAAAEAEAPILVSASQPATLSSAWYRNWRLAWIPATALAASLALVATLHSRYAAPAPEMAKVVPQNELASHQLTPQEQSGTVATHAPAPSPVKNPSVGSTNFTMNRELAANRDSTMNFAPSSASSAASPAIPGTMALSPSEIHAAPAPPMEAAPPPPSLKAVAQNNSEPAVAAWQQEQMRMYDARSANANTSQISRGSAFETMDTGRSNSGGSAYNAAPRMAKKSPSASSFATASAQPRAKAPASLATGSLNLPSGLSAVSSATARHLMLEIDRAGTLYLSRDSGQNWEQVARQWTGRATEVRVLSGDGASEEKFELKNDSGSIWVSADGKSWTAQ